MRAIPLRTESHAGASRARGRGLHCQRLPVHAQQQRHRHLDLRGREEGLSRASRARPLLALLAVRLRDQSAPWRWHGLGPRQQLT